MNKLEYDYLKDYYIPFNTKEEMIEVAKFLHDVAGYKVCSYSEVIYGEGYDLGSHLFYIYAGPDDIGLKDQFYRTDTTHKKIKLDIQDLGIKRKRKILNLEDDPFGEENWGYTDESSNLKKFKDFI